MIVHSLTSDNMERRTENEQNKQTTVQKYMKQICLGPTIVKLKPTYLILSFELNFFYDTAFLTSKQDCLHAQRAFFGVSAEQEKTNLEINKQDGSATVASLLFRINPQLEWRIASFLSTRNCVTVALVQSCCALPVYCLFIA